MPKSRGNGEGSIYKNEAKGLWVAQYSYGRKPDGSRYRKTLYAKTRKEVKKKLEEFTASVNAGNAASPSTIKIGSLAESIIKDEFAINALSENTYARKMNTLKIIQGAPIGDILVQKIDEDIVMAFLSTLTSYSDSTISKVYGLLNKTLSVALERGIISFNPMSLSTIKKPKSKKATKKISALSIDEQKKVISALCNESQTLCNDYRVQMLLSLFTGMRMGEINALMVGDIDIKNKTIHIHRTMTRDKDYKPVIGEKTKTYAGTRDIAISDTACKLLQDYLTNLEPNPENLLFWDKRKQSYITSNQVNMEFKRLCQTIGINKDVNQHMLRHTFATRCIEGGMPAKVLQKILGHKDIRITLNTYCDVFEAYESKHIEQADIYLKNNGLTF